LTVALICSLINLYIFVLFVRVVLSWFPINPNGPVGQVSRLVHAATDPVLVPVRRMLPNMGPLDLSPIVVWIVLGIIVPTLIGC
jgi:YggT family protein